ncbi:MAG TPA: hypothetical protein VHE78_14145 [Gemmatimonadaceae bacterium]|nr:hypothetical protein [Gemmatimonadaceae bacterium]
MTAPQAAREVQSLSRELSDFLIEFAIVLNKHGIYPPGHPLLDASRAVFANRLMALLAERESISLGVAQNQFIIEGLATETSNALLRDLARRLHRQHIAAIRIVRGASARELNEFLKTLASDSSRESPIGLRPESERKWDHIHVFAITYRSLELDEGGRPAAPGSAAHLWIELARATLPDDGSAVTGDPSMVAQAINKRDRDVAYDQVVVGYLLQLSEELKRADEADTAAVRERVSDLVRALDPSALQRLLAMGGEQKQGMQLVRHATDTLAAEAVIELLGAAAVTTKRSISHGMLLMLAKLAKHSTDGTVRARAEGDSALRENVKRLLDDWELDDPNPEEYSAVLERMSKRTPAYAPVAQTEDVGPEHIVELAIEVGEASRAAFDAAEEMVEKGDMAQLMGILAHAPDGSAAADAIWRRISRPERLRQELDRPRPNFDVVETLVGRLGLGATDTLLDVLAHAVDRSTRWSALRLLTEIGSGIGPRVVERLPAAAWYLQRNLLILLGRLEAWPDGFTPADYARHADARVRREALKLMMGATVLHTEGVMMGLRDPDQGIVRLSLNAILDSCPPGALPLVRGILDAPGSQDELCVLCLRIVANARAPGALERLVHVARPRRGLFGWKLADKSPMVLAAIAGLLANWPTDPQARRVLGIAARHADPEMRAAAGAVRQT